MCLCTKFFLILFFYIVINNEYDYCYGQHPLPPMLNLMNMGTHLLQNNALFDIGGFDEVENDFGFGENSASDSVFVPGRYFNTTELINRRGYKAEVYNVETEDGYILKLTHIVTGNKGPYLPVLLQHGVLAASDQWLLRGHNKDFAFILADNGYDVWLGDQRGNVYSRSHVTYQTTEPKFWDFSFHESGSYDLPAFIVKIMEETQAPEVSYVGHSMGTTVFLVMAAQRPEIAKYVRLSILLAPVCFPPQPSQSSIINMLLPNSETIVNSLARMNRYEFLPRNSRTQRALHTLCSAKVGLDTCLTLVGNIYGDNRRNLDKNLVPFYFSSVPAGTSLKTMSHLTQVFRSGVFQQYDYGLEGNIAKYGQKTPPRYKLEEIRTPIALVYGNNDGFLSRQTVRKLSSVLPNVILRYEVIDPSFSHLDFMFGNDAKPLVFDKLFKLLNKYNTIESK